MSERRRPILDLVSTPAVLVPAAVAGFWPVWRWYLARMTDRSDEPLGWLALIAAVVFLPRAGWQTGRPAAGLGAAAAILVLYIGTWDFAPPLIRAALAMVVLALLVPRRSGVSPAPVGALLLLSLPVIASLQYYLGFPVRVVTTSIAATVLRLAGFSVSAQGTLLTGPLGDVLIDAPCSGIRMLWIAAFLSATLAAWHRLSAGRYVVLAVTTGATVFVANLARCLVLYLIETGSWSNPPGGHDAIGLSAFALVIAVCGWTAHRLASPPVEARAQCHVLRDTGPGRRSVLGAVVLGIFVVATVRPAGSRAAVPEGSAEIAVAWPTHFEERPLESAALHPFEAALARDFPGAMAAFTDGERRIVVREMSRATRKVHPIADCLRAAGFLVRPVAAWRDAEGRLWAAIEAERDGEWLFVRERFSGAEGGSWTDASAWFWAAWLHPHAGPWRAVTVFATREES